MLIHYSASRNEDKTKFCQFSRQAATLQHNIRFNSAIANRNKKLGYHTGTASCSTSCLYCTVIESYLSKVVHFSYPTCTWRAYVLLVLLSFFKCRSCHSTGGPWEYANVQKYALLCCFHHSL